MKEKKEHILLFTRILICIVVLNCAGHVLGMGGDIVDWYADKDIIYMVQETFLCHEAPWMIFLAALLLVFLDVCRICWYFIKIYLLERKCLLKAGKLYHILWVAAVVCSFWILAIAWRKLTPYSEAVVSIAKTKSLEEMNQILSEEKDVIIYVTRRGCGQCSNTTQQLLHILPEVKGTFMVHYDTAEDRENRANEMYSLLDRLSVVTVPSIAFVSDGQVTKLLDKGVDDASLREYLVNFSDEEQ